MPRPNPAQLLYGSATVICSTLAMLLLSQTRSSGWIAVIAIAALALGLLVALTAPSAHATLRRRTAAGRATARASVRSAARPGAVSARRPATARSVASPSPTTSAASAAAPATMGAARH